MQRCFLYRLVKQRGAGVSLVKKVLEAEQSSEEGGRAGRRKMDLLRRKPSW